MRASLTSEFGPQTDTTEAVAVIEANIKRLQEQKIDLIKEESDFTLIG